MTEQTKEVKEKSCLNGWSKAFNLRSENKSDLKKCAFMYHFKVLFFHSPFLVFSALI